jgi:hypothetical protein
MERRLPLVVALVEWKRPSALLFERVLPLAEEVDGVDGDDSCEGKINNILKIIIQ